ncbi:MAG: LysM peptidoglycan-binding domain-containing protein [Caldilineaceae bacterium]|nr:LysM peptidoglycan-binding domain-containing protein [Caldilineaceae bacterium]
MSGYITDTLGWLAGAFYVIVALSIVYLYFFRIAPIVIGSIKEWNIFVVLRVTIVLASLAFLLGCVAVITGDWIFSQVLDTLPRTRMAREIDRVTGSLVRISVPETYGSPANYSSGAAGIGAVPANAPAGAVGPAPAPTEAPVSFPLKTNAIDIWVATIQQLYNSTGKLSDNTMVMTRRDLPQGVTCDVAAVARGWFPKQYEEWQLLCSMDGFRSTRSLRLNGTAVRGLTGGGYYEEGNPYSVYGEGLWPEQAYDMSNPVQPTPAPTGTSSEPQGGPSNQTGAIATGSRNHTVQQGESLALIAQRYEVKVDTLVAANLQKYPRLKTNPNVIVVGWVLNIPDSE